MVFRIEFAKSVLEIEAILEALILKAYMTPVPGFLKRFTALGTLG
jgi:hypothetical protein